MVSKGPGPKRARSAATELEAELTGGTSTSYDSSPSQSRSHSQGEIREFVFRTAMSAFWRSSGNGSCVLTLITNGDA